MASILTNVASLTAQRYLNTNEASLSNTIQQLSSGLRINSAADDAAGYIRSASLSSQVSSLNQGVKNTQDAISEIQTALGAINQQVTLLGQLRSLALQAANSGVNSTSTVAADQTQVDAIVNSIDSIATSTTFGGKYLLNGAAGESFQQLDYANVGSVNMSGYTGSNSGTLTAVVTTAATQTGFQSATNWTTAAGALTANENLVFTLGGSQVSVTATSTDTVTTLENKLTGAMAAANISGFTVGDDTSGHIQITSSGYGTGQTIAISDAGTHFLAAGDTVGLATGATRGNHTTSNFSSTGVDVAGKIYSGTTVVNASATGAGLVLTANAASPFNGVAITLTSAGNADVAPITVGTVTSGALTFQTGANAGNTASTTIPSFRSTALGSSATTLGSTTGLSALKTGNQYYSLSASPSAALAVIDQAITDATTAAAQLGAFQSDTLQPTTAIDQVASQNVTAALSNLQDVDVAAATANMTQQNILVQAATAVLAQANTIPQVALKLLGA
jgi:flagellin